jgi:yeast amino acid transporter
MTQAAFSFIGTEIVAVSKARHSRMCFLSTYLVHYQIAAGEAKNPRYLASRSRQINQTNNTHRRNLPKAIRRVYIRILLFYIGGTIIIGLLVPQDSPGLDLDATNAASSPFVIAIQNAGISGLPSVTRLLFFIEFSDSDQSPRSSTLAC